MSTPEIRVDQLTGSRVLLAAGRSDRPQGIAAPQRQTKGPEGCPFCEGHEDHTPAEVWADRPDGGGADSTGWIVRSVPNLYPALAPVETAGDGQEREKSSFASSADPLRASARIGEPDLFSSRPAVGAHEVIINSPAHHDSIADLKPSQLEAAVSGWRQRIAHHMSRGATYVQLIVNEGLAAGASLEHSHAQLYALGFVPASIARERERVASYSEGTSGGTLLMDVLIQEIRRQDRLVAIDDEAALICPWASRSPYELRLIPRNVEPRFQDSSAGTKMLATALELWRRRFGHLPPLNIWLRNAPRGDGPFHWHIDMAPRLTTRASFEMATEVEICVVAPERAAAELRDCL